MFFSILSKSFHADQGYEECERLLSRPKSRASELYRRQVVAETGSGLLLRRPNKDELS